MGYRLDDYGLPDKSNLFSNGFSMSYSNRILEDSYDKSRMKSPFGAKIFYAGFSFIGCLSLLISILTFESDKTLSFKADNPQISGVAWFFTSVSLVNTAIGIASKLLKPGHKAKFQLLSVFSWTNLISLELLFLLLRLFFNAKYRSIYYTPEFGIYRDLIDFTDFLMVIFFFVYVERRFYSLLAVMTSVSVIFAVVFSFQGFSVTSGSDVVKYVLIKALLVIIGYLSEYSLKVLFYISNKLLKKSNLLNSTMLHIKNGVIIYSKDSNKIKFINSFGRDLNRLITKRSGSIQSNPPSNTSSEKNAIYIPSSANFIDYTPSGKGVSLETDNGDGRTFSDRDDPNLTILAIFNNLYDVTDILSPLVRDTFLKSDLGDILKELESSHEKYNCFEEFFYLGLLEIRKGDVMPYTPVELQEKTILEVSLRIDKSSYNTFEFIFTDVTKSKTVNIEKVELKTGNIAKSIVKFSTPIKELNEGLVKVVEKIQEKEKAKKDKQFSRKSTFNEELSTDLDYTINLNKYLLLAVKDLEIYSKIHNHVDVSLNNEWINVREEMVALEKIVNILFKTFNVFNKVMFMLIVDDQVPNYMYVDKIKLFQMLVNLIRNSIEYANVSTGCIKLKVLLVEKRNLMENPSIDYKLDEKFMVRFQVIDFGKGIKKEEEKEILKKIQLVPDEKSKGSGLWIVANICKLYDTKLVYKKNYPNGTCFSFDINLEPSSDLTERNIHSMDFFRIEKPKTYETEKTEIDTGNPYNYKHHLATESTELNNLTENNFQIEIRNTPRKTQEMSSIEGETKRKNNAYMNNFRKMLFSDDSKQKSVELNSFIYTDDRLIQGEGQMSFHGFQSLQSIQGDQIISDSTERRQFNALNSNNPISKKMTFLDDIIEAKDEDLHHYAGNRNIIRIDDLINPTGEVILDYKIGTTRKVIQKASITYNRKTILIVDKEKYSRKSIIRLLEDFYLKRDESFELFIIEVSDGIECLNLINFANKNGISIDLILAEDNSSFISGRVCSNVLQELVMEKKIREIPMFISTDLNDKVKESVNGIDNLVVSLKNKFSSVVKNVYPKPLEISHFEEIMKQCEA